MRLVIRYVVIPVFAALLITSATYFVGTFVAVSMPGGHGDAGSAFVYGFPIPFVTFFPCCSGTDGLGYSVSLDNTSFYHPLNLVADFAIWFAISKRLLQPLRLRDFF